MGPIHNMHIKVMVVLSIYMPVLWLW